MFLFWTELYILVISRNRRDLFRQYIEKITANNKEHSPWCGYTKKQKKKKKKKDQPSTFDDCTDWNIANSEHHSDFSVEIILTTQRQGLAIWSID